jgi:hypothetical protein
MSGTSDCERAVPGYGVVELAQKTQTMSFAIMKALKSLLQGSG